MFNILPAGFEYRIARDYTGCWCIYLFDNINRLVSTGRMMDGSYPTPTVIDAVIKQGVEILQNRGVK